MFPRKYKKQNKLKKFLLKILNIYGFEKETKFYLKSSSL